MFWEEPFERIFEELERMRRRLQGLVPTPSFAETFPLDLIDEEDELVIRADLPGFRKDEVSVRLDETTLSIQARHKEKRVERAERFYRAERKVGVLRRTLTLPTEVKPETARAKLENGVLEIRVKKAKPRKRGKEVRIE